MELDDEVVHAVRSAECTGNLLRIRARLDRPLYVRTNKALEAAGGRWSRREQAHVFEEDAADVVARLLADGGVTTNADIGCARSVVVGDFLSLTPRPAYDRW